MKTWIKRVWPLVTKSTMREVVEAHRKAVEFEWEERFRIATRPIDENLVKKQTFIVANPNFIVTGSAGGNEILVECRSFSWGYSLNVGFIASVGSDEGATIIADLCSKKVKGFLMDFLTQEQKTGGQQ